MTPSLAFEIPKAGERRRLLIFTLVYACIWLLTWYSARVFETMGAVSLWYLPAGLRFFCLLLLGPIGVLVELFTALLLLLLQALLTGTPSLGLWSSDWVWAIYNLFAFPIAYAVVVLPLRWRFRNTLDFAHQIHSVLFLIAAMAAAALAASAGTFNLVTSGVIAPSQASELFFNWLTGDFIGIVTLTPLLWIVVSPRVWPWLLHGTRQPPPRDHSMVDHGRTYRNTTLVVVLALALLFAIPHFFGVTRISPVAALLLLLPLAGLTLRYGMRSAVLSIVLLDSGLVASVSVLDQRHLALQYQLVMVAIALVGLWLGGAVESNRRVIARLKDFSNVSNDLLWETDKLGSLRTSGSLASELALEPVASWSSLFKGISQPDLDALQKALSQRKPFYRMEVGLQQGTEPRRWFSINGLPLWDPSGASKGYRGTATEITEAVNARALLNNYNHELLSQVAQRTQELIRSNAELAIKEQHLQVLLAAAPVGVLEFDQQDQCCYLNENASMLVGISKEGTLGRHLHDLIDPNDRERVLHHWDGTTAQSGMQSVEFRLKHSGLWCACYWIKFKRPEQPASANAIMVLVDATARYQQEQRLWTLAHHDALTGLPNRALFMDRCNQVLTQARRNGQVSALLWLDLDGFKSVNDTLGHAAGDTLLQHIAQRLKSRVRDGDTVARMGGDEFAIILPDVSQADQALQIAHTLREMLATPYHLPQGVATISASIGIALYPLHATTVEALMQQADSAMYKVKRSSKNMVQLAGADS